MRDTYSPKAARGHSFLMRARSGSPAVRLYCSRSTSRRHATGFHLVNRLVGVGRTRDDSATRAIDLQVGLFENGLSDEHFVTDHHGVIEGVPLQKYELVP